MVKKKMKTGKAHKCKMVDSKSGLEDFAKALELKQIIGVDLEADSMYHFKEKVCLLQIATEHVNAVIDPIQINDLSALKPVFRRREIQKVFHGADYDVRSLYRDFGIAINNLFDTELACRFLGFKETGLNAVLNKKYNVKLDKKYQRKDWSKRPLPEDMIAYAAKDVRYLVPLARSLQHELKQKDRLFWVHEECNYLSKVRPALTDTGPLFLSFKGSGRLRPRNLAVLEALLQLRKQIAQKKDKPLFRIIGNKSLLRLAETTPMSFKSLERTKALSIKQIDLYGTKVIAAVKKTMRLSATNLPEFPRKTAPVVPAAVAKRVKALRIWRDRRAKKLKIDPAIICTKALMSAIAMQRPLNLTSLSKINEMKRWQIQEFGNEIVSILKNVG